jgi:hypothetical protein
MKTASPQLERFNPSKLASLPIVVAWLMFVASFFLPATNVVGRPGTRPGTPLSGWDAFYSSLMILGAHPIIVIAEPRSLLFLTFPLINLAMILIPLFALGDPEHAPVFGAPLAPLGLIPLLLPKTLTGDVFVGFYLWISSFFAMSAGCLWFGLCYRWAWQAHLERSYRNRPRL